MDRVAGAFDHGVGFAGQRGFIDQSHSIGNLAIDRDAFTRTDQNFVAGFDAVDGDRFAMTGGVDALAKIEGCADFFDRTP